ncbi:hypothetical protein ACSBR1_017234 [Camellia fascicularis]
MVGSKTSSLLILLIIIVFFFFNIVSSHKVPRPPANPPAKCPKDTLKFGVCGEWLGLVTEVIGTKPNPQCCTVVKGLADLEAALCLCTAIKADVLGVIKLEVPIALSLVINGCGKKVPEGFVCA